jgi:hypothetical protein
VGTAPPDGRDDPTAAFRELYDDPVLINGVPVPVLELVGHARTLHSAFTEHDIRITERIDEPGKLAIAFRHTAATGARDDAGGRARPTGRMVTGARH